MSTDNDDETVSITVAPRSAGGAFEDLAVNGAGIAAEERFDFVGRVGKGGMGDVLLAEDRDLQRTVAVKILSGDVESSSPLAWRFYTEAQITAQLDHPNIMPVYGMEVTEAGKPAFTMKLIRGLTFREYTDECLEVMAKGEDLDHAHRLETRLEHFVQVCDAMAYSHNRGVIHRDLKPANIMLGAFNEVCVMDWGIAKLVDRDEIGRDELAEIQTLESPGDTHLGTIIGTPLYMSPEQAEGAPDLTPKSDQYALGLILHELICLKQAVPGGKVFTILSQAQTAHREPLIFSDGSGVPEELEAIVAKACQIRPEDRYADVGALADDVRSFLHGMETTVLPDNLPRKIWRWSRRHPTAFVGIVSGVILACALMVLLAQWQHASLERSAAVLEEHHAHLISRVTRQSHVIDSNLQSYEVLLYGVAETAISQYKAGEPKEGDLFSVGDLASGRVPADWSEREAYGGEALSFRVPSHTYAPGVEPESVEVYLRKLLSLRYQFRRAVLRSIKHEALFWDDEKANNYLGEVGAPASWVYVALKHGVLIKYPASAEHRPGYDPRREGWFKDAEQRRVLAWSHAYKDEHFGILVPCTIGLYDHLGEFFGVVGLEVTLDTALSLMAVDLDGVIDAYLVDSDGNIVVAASQATDSDLTISETPFPNEIVRQEMIAGEPYGFEDAGDEDIIFNRMAALGWYYAVRVAEHPEDILQ